MTQEILPNLNTEEMMLLEKNYRNFILGGAGLDEGKKAKFREISEELSKLSVKFEENVLEDTNVFELHITERDDLEGLPEGVVEMASMEARDRKKEGWIFTLHFPSYIAFHEVFCQERTQGKNVQGILFKGISRG